MKFATATHIVCMVIVITAGCYIIDYFANPQLWKHGTQSFFGAYRIPHLTVWIDHPCCSTCLDEVREALKAAPGIDVVHAVSKDLLGAGQTQSALLDGESSVDLPVTDAAKVDLVAMDKALRDRGLIAAKMEFGGLEHFHLEATLDRRACGLRDGETQERIAFLKARRQGGQLDWLDDVVVDGDQKTIVAHARYLRPGGTVDLADFLAVLNDAGYVPRSLKIATNEGHTTVVARQ